MQLGGVNREVFQPYPGPKRYPLLCSGEQQRAWKGTDTILEAGELLGIPVARYAGKNLDQPALGREYASARCSRSGAGSRVSASPASKSLACGTPLVTTDNGGCREYAVDGETALVVPPRDARAMADAVQRLLDDDAFAARLVANGLDVVERDFDWEKRTDEFEAVLDGLCAGPAPAPPPTSGGTDEPELSVVVLAWDNLLYTQQFADSVRRNTDVPYELVIVDNGSEWEAANYARGRRPGRAQRHQPRFRARHESGPRRRARPLRRVLQQRHDRSPRLGLAPRADGALPSERGDRRARGHRGAIR